MTAGGPLAGRTVAATLTLTALGSPAAFGQPMASRLSTPPASIERPGSGCLLPPRRPATPGVQIPAPPGVRVTPGTPIVPTEPNNVSATAQGGRASLRLRLHLQMGLNDVTRKPLRGALFGATICRKRTDGRWQRVADPRWSVHPGHSTILVTTAWLRARSVAASPLVPGRYRIHVGLSYWWGQRNLVVQIN